jgi:hypothetical protein
MFLINNRLGRAQLFAGLNHKISAPGSFFTGMWPGGMLDGVASLENLIAAGVPSGHRP